MMGKHCMVEGRHCYLLGCNLAESMVICSVSAARVADLSVGGGVTLWPCARPSCGRLAPLK